MRKVHTILAICVIAIVLMLIANVGASLATPIKPGPAQPLSGCPMGTYGGFYNGWRVIVTDNTLGQVLLDTTGPVQRNFQLWWDGMPIGAADNYSVQAYAYPTSPGTPGIWLIDTSGLHC